MATLPNVTRALQNRAKDSSRVQSWGQRKQCYRDRPEAKPFPATFTSQWFTIAHHTVLSSPKLQLLPKTTHWVVTQTLRHGHTTSGSCQECTGKFNTTVQTKTTLWFIVLKTPAWSFSLLTSAVILKKEHDLMLTLTQFDFAQSLEASHYHTAAFFTTKLHSRMFCPFPIQLDCSSSPPCYACSTLNTGKHKSISS